ncbi:unnamed protein product [Fraxinus pennsylvanica]|uniref:Uncharacterized protein n=1 Tax=Fraxinus pennsylvanica TaxID=56036 RepID=A0AAD2E4G9_9LAMI|nr:unnamed protein product [Fraxinus pennsylvanica]
MMPKIDKSGRFCSPRAARELALMILYAACLEGSDPVRLFEKRLNSRRGPPVTTETTEEANELLSNHEKETEIEAEVLSAPPKLVYSKLILHFTRKLLVAVVEKWDSNVLVINKVAPPNWKDEPVGRILEISILHLAMSEIAVLGTRHQIVINEVSAFFDLFEILLMHSDNSFTQTQVLCSPLCEPANQAVDLAKRFCDGQRHV